MKKLVVLVCSLLLLCGCSQKERMACVHCGERVTEWIMRQDGDAVCVKCFSDKGYLVCRNCMDIYDPDNCYYPDFSYCAECEDEFVGLCWRCDTAYPLNLLSLAKDGERYICALCNNEKLTEIINDPNLFKLTDDDYANAYEDGYEIGFDDGYECGAEDEYDKISDLLSILGVEINP